MLVSEIISNIQNNLSDKGVYRTDSFVLDSINHGQRLISVLSLFDERRGSVSLTGTRNMAGVPSGMLVPIYVANTTSGKRVSPVRLNEVEFYSGEWEGVVDGSDVDYYTVLNLHHEAETELWCVPLVEGSGTELSIIGAYVPDEVVASGTPSLPEAYQDLLFLYGSFAGFVSEPRRSQDAGRMYGLFVERLNEFIGAIKSRFPSGYLFSPQPVEFVFESITRQQQKVPETNAQPPEEGNDASR